MHILVIQVDVLNLFCKVNHIVARHVEFCSHVINLTVKGILRVLRALHSLKAWLVFQRIRRILKLVRRVLHRRNLGSVNTLKRCHSVPRLSLLIGAIELKGSFKSVLMLSYQAVLKVVSKVLHGRQNSQAKEQEQRGKAQTQKECGKVTEVA